MKCSICGSDNVKFFERSERYNFDVYMCFDCRVGFRYPMPSKEEVSNFYSKEYYTGNSYYSYLDERRVKGSSFVWRERIDKLIKIYEGFNKIKPSNIIDIGCSFGGLLLEASKFGLKPYGVEISSYSSYYARRRGIEVFEGHLDDVDLPKGFFDIATMVEVIEHLDNPLKSVKKVFESLREGGVFLVQTANILGLQSRFYGGRYHYYIPGHLHYFSNVGLRKLLKSVGFREVLEFYPVEFGLLPKLIKVYLNASGLDRYLKLVKTGMYHVLGKVKVGNLTLMSSMVVVGIK
jgi:SAM-dependent methyltransferase